MDLHVIILNWNASDDTVNCVQQLLQWSVLTPRIWVVDNASAAGDMEAVADAIAASSTVTLIRSEINRGFSGGSNLGIQTALDEERLPILLLNNDAALSEETAMRLLQTLRSNQEHGIVGPVIYADASHSRIVSAGSRNPVLHLHNQILTAPPDVVRSGTAQSAIEPTTVVDYISGAVALVRPELFERAGLFDEEYFFSGEVADLCRRAKQQGFFCLVDGEAKAHHNLERSSAQRGIIHTYYIVRNRFLYIRKFYGLLRPPLTAFWAAYGRLLAWKLRLFGNYPTSKAVEMATMDGLLGRFGGQNERVVAAAESVRPQAPIAGKKPS